MMKTTFAAMAALLAAGCCDRCREEATAPRAVSPDGKNEIVLSTNPLAYEVRRNGKTLVAKTEIGMKIDGKAIGAGTPTVTARALSGSVKTPVYKKASISLDGNETFADFGAWGVRLVARDDGVAYRFETKMPGEITVNCEKAGVTLAPATKTWVNRTLWTYYGDPLQTSWESVNETLEAERIETPADKIVYLPLVYQADGAVVCVTESDLVGYPGWNLKAEKKDGDVLLRGEFAKIPVECINQGGGEGMKPTQRQRAIKITKRGDYLVKTAGARTFPWRCFLVADDASQLVANDLVMALARPQAFADTDWIRPGKVAWDWWNGWDNLGQEKGCTTKGYERFIDFAAKNGVEYVIFDEGWSEHLNIWKLSPSVDVPHLIRYGRERGVGIILWMAWAQILGEEEKVVSVFSKMGAAGFKVDFMDRDDAPCVDFLWKFAACCAKERMLIDYHGMYKPTGMERAYPNILNFEGVHGLEQMKWYNPKVDMSASDVKSYFVRMSAGPMDYTPGAMDNYPVSDGENAAYKGTNFNPGSVGTRCHQMAMMTAYFAPLQMLSDAPTKYERNAECFAFMAETPVVWDDTVGLAGSPDTYGSCARRKGDVWYAAGLGNKAAYDYVLDASFLGAGDWTMEIFRDAPDSDVEPTHYVHEKKPVKAGEKIPFRFARGGGFAAKFTKVP